MFFNEDDDSPFNVLITYLISAGCDILIGTVLLKLVTSLTKILPTVCSSPRETIFVPPRTSFDAFLVETRVVSWGGWKTIDGGC